MGYDFQKISQHDTPSLKRLFGTWDKSSSNQEFGDISNKKICPTYDGMWRKKQSTISLWSTVGGTVMTRYPSATKSVSKRHVLKADLVDRNVPKHKYKVKFVSPMSGEVDWEMDFCKWHNKSNHGKRKEKTKSCNKMFVRRKKSTAKNIFIVMRTRGPYLKIEQAPPISLFPLIPQRMETARC